MTVITGTILSMAQADAAQPSPASLAIYYGYPSLVNGAKGDVEKAAAAFSIYEVVVFGDGLEFSDRQSSRIAQGDPAEHQKVVQIIAAMKRRNPEIRVFGYVPLGDYRRLVLSGVFTGSVGVADVVYNPMRTTCCWPREEQAER